MNIFGKYLVIGFALLVIAGAITRYHEIYIQGAIVFGVIWICIALATKKDRD